MLPANSLPCQPLASKSGQSGVAKATASLSLRDTHRQYIRQLLESVPSLKSDPVLAGLSGSGKSSSSEEIANAMVRGGTLSADASSQDKKHILILLAILPKHMHPLSQSEQQAAIDLLKEYALRLIGKSTTACCITNTRSQEIYQALQQLMKERLQEPVLEKAHATKMKFQSTAARTRILQSQSGQAEQGGATFKSPPFLNMEANEQSLHADKRSHARSDSRQFRIQRLIEGWNKDLKRCEQSISATGLETRIGQLEELRAIQPSDKARQTDVEIQQLMRELKPLSSEKLRLQASIRQAKNKLFDATFLQGKDELIDCSIESYLAKNKDMLNRSHARSPEESKLA
jgi:hypothetical protein